MTSMNEAESNSDGEFTYQYGWSLYIVFPTLVFCGINIIVHTNRYVKEFLAVRKRRTKDMEVKGT